MTAWLLAVALADPIDGAAMVTLRAGLRAWGEDQARPVVVVAADPRVAPVLEGLRTNTPGLKLRPVTDPALATGCFVTVFGPTGDVWTLRGSEACPGVKLAGLPSPRDAVDARSWELPIGLGASVLTTALVAAPLLRVQPAAGVGFGIPAGWAAGTLAVTASAPRFARLEAGFGALGSLAMVSGGFLAVGLATQEVGWVAAGGLLSIAAPAVGGHLMVRHARYLRRGPRSGPPVVAPAASAADWVVGTCGLRVEGVQAEEGRIAVQPGAVPADEVEACLAAWDRQDRVVDWTSASVGSDGVVWTQLP